MHRLKEKIGLLTLLALSAGRSAPAFAEDAQPVVSTGTDPALGLDPSTPQTAALPGGVTPAYGQRSISEGEWRFDFHGFLTAPLPVGIGTRDMPTPDQSGTTLHTPPAVPDEWRGEYAARGQPPRLRLFPRAARVRRDPCASRQEWEEKMGAP